MSRHQHIQAWLADVASDLHAIRHDIHAHPELGFEESRTSALVARLLEEWGYEVPVSYTHLTLPTKRIV